MDHADRGTATTIAVLWLTFVGLTVILISWISEDLDWGDKLLPAYLLVIPGSVVLALALRIARRLAVVGGQREGRRASPCFWSPCCRMRRSSFCCSPISSSWLGRRLSTSSTSRPIAKHPPDLWKDTAGTAGSDSATRTQLGPEVDPALIPG